MIFQSEASLQMLIAQAFDEIAAIKRIQRLIKLSQEAEDLETICLLLELHESHFNCFIERLEYSLHYAQKKVEQLPEDFR